MNPSFDAQSLAIDDRKPEYFTKPIACAKCQTIVNQDNNKHIANVLNKNIEIFWKGDDYQSYEKNHGQNLKGFE